jgi:CHASE1-domain containing sensor protein
VPGFLQTWPLAFRPKSSILVSSEQRIMFLIVWGIVLGAFLVLVLGALENSKRDVMFRLLRSGFRLATLP